jgi:hypothetical protein
MPPDCLLTEDVFLEAWLHWYLKSTNLVECEKSSSSQDCSFCKFVLAKDRFYNCRHCPAMGFWHGNLLGDGPASCQYGGEWSEWNLERTLETAQGILHVIERAYIRWKAKSDGQKTN